MSRWPVAGPSEYWLLASSPASKVKKKCTPKLLNSSPILLQRKYTASGSPKSSVRLTHLPSDATGPVLYVIVHFPRWETSRAPVHDSALHTIYIAAQAEEIRQMSVLFWTLSCKPLETALRFHIQLTNKKVKQSHYRPGVAQRVLRKLRFPDFVRSSSQFSYRIDQ